MTRGTAGDRAQEAHEGLVCRRGESSEMRIGRAWVLAGGATLPAHTSSCPAPAARAYEAVNHDLASAFHVIHIATQWP